MVLDGRCGKVVFTQVHRYCVSMENDKANNATLSVDSTTKEAVNDSGFLENLLHKIPLLVPFFFPSSMENLLAEINANSMPRKTRSNTRLSTR